MRTKKQKIRETLALLDQAKQQPLTKQERDFLTRHGYSPGQEILPIYDPGQKDQEIIDGMKDKLQTTIVIFISA